MRIFLFRGLLGDAFSTGINQLGDKLQAAGHSVSTHRWLNRKAVQKKYLEEIAAGKAPEELAVVGHSLGANAALSLANKFAEDGLPVRYLATLDATVEGTVNPNIGQADNFRSRDIRDKPVAGAVEHSRDDLNHVEIDKDIAVHNTIITRCSLPVDNLGAPENGGSEMKNDSDPNRPGEEVTTEALQTALDALAGSGALTGRQTSDDELAAIIKMLVRELEEPAHTQPTQAQPAQTQPVVHHSPQDNAAAEGELTPVNAAFGEGIGKLLDGRKTGIGILGLLATSVLPVLFPQSAPIVSLLQALGLGVETAQVAAENSEVVKETPNLLTPIFAALTSWGVLGKIDKWVGGYKVVKR